MASWLWLARLAKPYRWRLSLAAGLTAAACLLGLSAPLLTQRILVLASAEGASTDVAGPVLVLLAVVAMQATASSLNTLLVGGIALNLVRDIRRRLYERLHQMPLAWFDRTPTGTILSRIMDDAAAVQSLASGQTLVILLDVATAAAAGGWLVSRSWRLAAVVGCVLPIYAIVFRLIAPRIRAGTLEVRSQLDQVFSHLKQKIDGIVVVRATAAEADEISKFTRQMAALHEPRLRTNQLGIAFSNLCLGIGGAGASLVFAVGAGDVLAGRLTVGELIAASALAALLFTPITRLAELSTLLEQASASATRLAEILDQPAPFTRAGFWSPELPPARAASVALMPIGGEVEFDHITFQYLPDRPVLRDVSLRIEPGWKVAVVGPTGSGKTTLMNLLLRFYEPVSGEIRLDGQRLADLPLTALRELTGVVPQEPVIFRGTLADNIRYGTSHASMDAVLSAATAALVNQIAERLPEGYETVIGEGGHPLSQGERQRIAIGRLFCKNPSLVVLDEATSSLDRASEVLVQRALDNLLSGRTTFVIAHRLETVLTADQIVVMDQGRVVQIGRHDELVTDSAGLYRRLYECQFGSRAPGGFGSSPTDFPLARTEAASA